MDFIERIFAVSPDNGSGELELAIVFLLFALVAWRVMAKVRAGNRRGQSNPKT